MDFDGNEQQTIQPITHNFEVPVDPMDLLQCDSCQ